MAIHTAGKNRSFKLLNNVFEYKKGFECPRNETVKIRTTLFIPCTLQNHKGLLIVAASNGEAVEYLLGNGGYGCNDWRVCKNKFTCSISSHQMNILQNKIILKGGDYMKRDSDNNNCT